MSVKVHVEDNLGEVDVFPTLDIACVLVREPHVVNLASSLRDRLSKLAK